jgi:hypothetical protein
VRNALLAKDHATMAYRLSKHSSGLLFLLTACAACTWAADEKTMDWWSLRPIRKPPPPSVSSLQDASWVQTPIDRFILTKLHEKGLRPSPPADRRTLLRRVTFDLIGLPPTQDEIEAFLADPAANSYEKVVDRLLASPHYGERWARHWMDVVHYAETHGHDQDRPRPYAWPYRDYLIRAFNEDRPYARFAQEQIAGDVLFPDDPQGIVATGLLATGPWDESSLQSIMDDTADKRIAQYLDRDDMLSTVMSTFVSTTVHCARCHDHKFDPITQKDYYALQAVFAGVDKADRPYDADVRTARRRRELLGKNTRLQTLRNTAVAALLSPAAQAAMYVREKQVIEQLAALPPPSWVYAATSDFKPDGNFRPAKTPRPIHVLYRGDISKPRQEAAPGALACLAELQHHFRLTDPKNEGARRAALARWITDPKNVLTWRSIVNRVWHYHFGRGIVGTPNDLGRMGAAPTHPELLDWLAAEFQESGGSLKRLHRLIVTSAVYRQSSRPQPSYAAIDADNHYLWRMNRMRLDAESVRDAVLRATGKLDLKMGGPSVKQFIQTPGIHVTPNVDYLNFDVDRPENYRRSVYRFLFRTLPDPFMDTLDCPDSSQLTPARNTSVSPLQALAMLNNRFMVRQSEHLAERAAKAGKDLPAQIRTVYQLALGREPTAKEVRSLAEYAGKHGLANACRIVLNSNEFLFVD